MKLINVFLLAVLSINISGCASIANTTPLAESMCGSVSTVGGSSCQKTRNKIYIGARKDAEAISDTNGLGIALPMIDLPLSAVLDTIFLPYTIPYTLFSK